MIPFKLDKMTKDSRKSRQRVSSDSYLTLILILVLLTQSVSAFEQTQEKNACSTKPLDPNLFVKDFSDQPTPLLHSTPYAIKNLATNHVFVHRTETVQLLKLSHWWELVPEATPNTYKLRNMDPELHDKMPILVRTVKIRQISANSYSLHPTSCNGRLGSGSIPWIYYDFLDENNIDHIDCNSTLSQTKPSKHYHYTFTSLNEHISSEGWDFRQNIVSIDSDPEQVALNFVTSPHAQPQLLRSAIINNCGTGNVEQEVEFSTEVTTLSRLHVKESFGVSTRSWRTATIRPGIGFKFPGVFDFSVGIKKEWHKESVEDKLEQREGTFVQEQGVSITTKETVRVGNHSCVKVDAKTAVLDNFPLPVVVTVEFKIDGSSTKERIEDAGNFMRLLKFSGKRLSYDEGAGVVTLRKNGVVELTSFVSMETNIQQVKCNCRKSM